jgi:hypothetical protein
MSCEPPCGSIGGHERRKIAVSIEGFIFDTRQHRTDGETPKPFDVLIFSDGRRKKREPNVVGQLPSHSIGQEIVQVAYFHPVGGGSHAIKADILDVAFLGLKGEGGGRRWEGRLISLPLTARGTESCRGGCIIWTQQPELWYCNKAKML